MCMWERRQYACGHHGKLRRMPYSCDVYHRYTYGECRFNRYRDRIYNIISYDDCYDCRSVFEFVRFH
ncbi:hypothetical protein QBC46DRAFT_272358 [Diplogelasinospora grovesii]|uniref:Uncharacterized protein n=1 Tax=Diplogelasinospora grovesii TaxID=303347 RepID=A0AAN6MX79_9PEZI|nr:hypothetical protein QBC46DRAFT_272358 [Diplogelasinospora grovesii]